jgi:hypothetical protein
VAAYAANWSADRGMMGRIMVFPRVLSDKELRQSDYDNCSLILFGTKETNAIIQKFADKLSMQLSNDAKDFCLTYVFPLNNHYVIVNSGLPWWTPKIPKNDQQAGMRMAFMNTTIDALRDYRDFVLFKNTPDEIISQGAFDNDWKVSAEESARLKASGVVSVK